MLLLQLADACIFAGELYLVLIFKKILFRTKKYHES